MSDDYALRVLSFGNGVQSSTLAHMAAIGEVGPMPDCAIFADTKIEAQEGYEHLRWIGSGNVLPFPIHTVSVGDLGERTAAAARHEASNLIPFYTKSPTGRRGILNRGCTRDFKIYAVRRKLRELLGYGPRERLPKSCRVELWIAITTEETIRATPSGVGWIDNRFPFLGLPPHDTPATRKTRYDCGLWLDRHERPRPPRSRCKVCPFTEDAEWARIKRETPDEFAEAVAVDKMARNGFPGSTQQCFIHDSLKPLDEVDFSTAEDRGQSNMLRECKGMCGL